MYRLQSIQQWLSATLAIAVVLTGLGLPYTHTGQVQTVEAQRATVVVGGNGTVQETISAGANTVIAGLQTTLNVKELTLDGIAWGLAKTAVQSMTRSIINWINSGFEGSPAFVSDLESFLIDRADEIAGDFIYNDPSLNFLCSPFQLDVRTALAVNYQDQTRGGASDTQCTLSDASDNIEGFLSGNFQDGGWPAMFELTQNPQNTPTGAYLAAEAELVARIADDRGRTVQELDWGNGFLSFKVCDGSSGAGGATENCDITTPGAVIADQLNKSLGAGQDALIEADEINEIIGALFNQLAQQALTGLNGLLGLGGSQSYSSGGYGPTGDQSFLEAMTEEDIVTDDQSLVSGAEPIQDAITNEEAYIELQQRIVDSIDTAAAAASSSCSSLTLPESLVNDREQASSSVATSQTILNTLETSLNDFNSATNAEERNVALAPFLELVSQNLAKNEVDVTRLRLSIENDINPQITQFNSQLDRSERNCRNNDGSSSIGG